MVLLMMAVAMDGCVFRVVESSRASLSVALHYRVGGVNVLGCGVDDCKWAVLVGLNLQSVCENVVGSMIYFQFTLSIGSLAVEGGEDRW